MFSFVRSISSVCSISAPLIFSLVHRIFFWKSLALLLAGYGTLAAD
jgi:hypothetical protein